MSVLNLRRDTARALRNSLDRDAVIVAGPDHPLLVEAPDVLVAEKGGLLAVYFRKVSELRSAERLYTRFVLSRLALPPQTRHVLVYETKDDVPSGLDRDFAEVLSSGPRSREVLAKIARDPSFDGGRSKVPDEVLAHVRRRFSEALRTTQIVQRLDRLERDSERGGARRRTERETTFDGLDGTVQHADISERRFDGADVQRLAIRTTRTAFALDNGVPYPTARNELGLAMVEAYRDFRGDPEKLVRAAAFAGWAVAPFSQRERLPNLAKHLEDRAGKAPR